MDKRRQDPKDDAMRREVNRQKQERKAMMDVEADEDMDMFEGDNMTGMMP